jgi:magnesium chelatase subunit I
VGGLEETVQQFQPKANKTEQLFFMELLLFGLAEYSQLSKNILEAKISFKDLFSSVFSGDIAFDEEEFNN